MRKVISGKKYRFQIVASKDQFYIEALHFDTSRFSYINNLNPILSAFNVDLNDPKVSDSQWEVSEKLAKLYFKEAIGFLLDRRFRSYVENILDQDRSLGEWENRETIK